MNTATLEALKRLYSGNSKLTVIVDAAWNAQWSSLPEAHPDVCDLLHLPETFWESIHVPVLYRDALHFCDIFSSREDGLRVLQFTPVQDNLPDADLMMQILQSITSSCTALYTLLEDADVDEFRLYPNAIMANVLRIYRYFFLQQEILRGQRGSWAADTFNICEMTERLCKQIQDLLRSFADVQFYCDSPKLFARGDVRGFQCAMLAAYLLCVRSPERNQHVHVRLISGEAKAELTITVKPGSRTRDDLAGQLEHFGSLDAERVLLTEYCHFLGSAPAFSEHEDAVTCRMQIPLSEDRHTLQLNTTSSSAESGYFNPRSVLLSRLRYRDFFV